jgi:hypothetical protein
MWSSLQTRHHGCWVGVLFLAAAVIAMVCLVASPLPSYAEGGGLSPNPVDPSFGQLWGASCPPAVTDFCVAVDVYGNAFMYNGTNWSTAGNVVPAGIYGSYVYVSCPSASFCAIVSDDGYAVTYNGQLWSSPVPIAPDVDDVSCASSTFCVATDGHNVVYFNGTNWQTSTTIDPAGYVTHVSCPSPAFCAATDSTGEAFTYNGTSWSTPTSVDPSVGMEALSCPSADFCMAVDNDGNSLTYNGVTWSSPTAMGTGDPLTVYYAVGNVVTYSGDGWSTPTVIDPPVGDDGLDLDGVSCPTASSCVAVDQDGNVFSFEGSSWSAPRNIDPIVGSLNDVSCANSNFCLAVDTFGYVLTYDGSIWSAPTEIDPSQLFSGNALGSVSCAPGDHIFCVVLDNADQSITYNGSVWSSPMADDGMYWVSCPTTSFCMAVGSGGARTYNGTSWSAPTTVPSGTYGVSCASKSFCMASDGNGIMTYDGTGWSGPTTLDSAGVYVTVACSTVTFCMVTDTAGNAFTYDGRSWSTPTEVDTAGVNLNGLSCSSASFCMAIDEFGNSFTYDGTVWSGPTVMDLSDLGVNAVSCPSTAFCMAVDRSSTVFTQNPNILPVPTVTSLSPNQGPATAPGVVTISGTGFSTTSGATVIDFGAGNPATGVSCSSNTTCTATVPPGTGTVDVTATVQGRISPLNVPSDEFTYVPSVASPPVTGVSLTTGLTSGGTLMTISGAGFSTTSGATVIDFGAGNPATGVSCSSSTTCAATTPPGTGTVDVTATVQGQTSAPNAPSDQFTYVPMEITTSSLPTGARRMRYRVALSAAGGQRPYKWFLISGALPTGVRLTSKGVLTGKPGVSGTFTFTVKVVDHTKRPQTRKSATKTLSIIIN